MLKKILLILSIIIIVIACFIFFKGPLYISFLKNCIQSDHINKEKIVRAYENNKNTFQQVVNFALEDKVDVTIDKGQDGNFTVTDVEIGKNTVVNLKNKELNIEIKKLLYELNYKHVVEDGNAVFFLRQTGIGFEQGIVFLKDGNKPNETNILVLETIEGNWYYYEAK